MILFNSHKRCFVSMQNIFKSVIAIFLLFYLIYFSLLKVDSLDTEKFLRNKSLSFIYISDLNLYPTPIVRQNVKHPLEKQYGLQIYESQAIFQEIIRYINHKFDFDLVVFGGNNISESSESTENTWQLFLDMASEIKTNFLLVIGLNEKKSVRNLDLIHSLKKNGVKTHDLWWSYKEKDFLLIGLDSSLLFNHNKHSTDQISFLKDVLLENKNNLTIIFLHKSILTPQGNIIKNETIEKFVEIIKANSQVKLVISGNEYLNRSKLIGTTTYLVSSSPIGYPCTFKHLEISSHSLKVKPQVIPLKGIVKKAEKSFIESELAYTLFGTNQKAIKNYVSRNMVDSDLEVFLPALKNR